MKAKGKKGNPSDEDRLAARGRGQDQASPPPLKSPTWQVTHTMGDLGLVFEDQSGMLPPEVEYWDWTEEPRRRYVYRFPVPRHSAVRGRVYPFGFPARRDLPHPLLDYEEWFSRDRGLDAVAASAGWPDRATLVEALVSPNVMTRVRAYLDIGGHFGFDNLDADPTVERADEDVEANPSDEDRLARRGQVVEPGKPCMECGVYVQPAVPCPDCQIVYCTLDQCIVHTECAGCGKYVTARDAQPCGVCGEPWCRTCWGDAAAEACARCTAREDEEAQHEPNPSDEDRLAARGQFQQDGLVVRPWTPGVTRVDIQARSIVFDGPVMTLLPSGLSWRHEALNWVPVGGGPAVHHFDVRARTEGWLVRLDVPGIRTSPGLATTGPDLEIKSGKNGRGSVEVRAALQPRQPGSSRRYRPRGLHAYLDVPPRQMNYLAPDGPRHWHAWTGFLKEGQHRFGPFQTMTAEAVPPPLVRENPSDEDRLAARGRADMTPVLRCSCPPDGPDPLCVQHGIDCEQCLDRAAGCCSECGRWACLAHSVDDYDVGGFRCTSCEPPSEGE